MVNLVVPFSSLHIRFFESAVNKIADLLDEKRRSALTKFLTDGLFPLVAEARAPREGRFLTVAHGDLWCNNIMYRHSEEDGSVAGVKLIDMQCPMVTRPAFDLAHLLFQVCAKIFFSTKKIF